MIAASTETSVRTVCPYCGVGCGMYLQVKGGRVVRVKGDPEHPANFGRLCTKGLTVGETIDTPNRLRYFMTRPDRAGAPVRVTPDAAIEATAQKLQAIIRQHGPDAVGFYLSGQISTEAQYVANKLAKGFWGTNNVDSNSRLCMASAASGYKASLGADAPPGSYADIEQAEAFFIIGSNMADCHPILFQRVLARKKASGAAIVVVDPRRTSTAAKADLHLAVKPGTDLCLLYGLLHLFARDGAIDAGFIEAHTDGWPALVADLMKYTPAYVSRTCEIEEAALCEAARILGQSAHWMSFWTMGLNQSTQGTANSSAVCSLHLATGTIGRPGCGPFSLTGQPNAMGGREVGYLASGLPGQRSVHSAADRVFCEHLWNVSPGTIGAQPGRAAVEMFDALARGKMKAIWIIGTNPVASMPRRARVREGLRQAEFVVVQDAYQTSETAAFADVLLPGAVWAEADGTMTNSERRVTRFQPAVPPPGDALADWEIVCRVAGEMGYAEAFGYADAEAIFDEFRGFYNPATHWDLRGMSYERLCNAPLQWPMGPGQMKGQAIRDREARSDRLRFPTSNGRARFVNHPVALPEETVDRAHPFVLNTGRLAHHWHTLTKTGEVAALNRLHPSPFVVLHPSDAQALGIAEGETASIGSRRGKLVLPVQLSTSVRPGSCFVPIHWNDRFGEQLCVNEATNDAVDPYSLQPELKVCAVRIEKTMTEPTQEEALLALLGEGRRMAEATHAFSTAQRQAIVSAFNAAFTHGS
ncbi:MAG: molybdopterin oxidoreductase family protein [Opitutales bacterium]